MVDTSIRVRGENIQYAYEPVLGPVHPQETPPTYPDAPCDWDYLATFPNLHVAILHLYFFFQQNYPIITFGVPWPACCGRNLPWSAAVRTQALELDFQAYLITDATKPVSEQQGASARAELQHLRRKNKNTVIFC